MKLANNLILCLILSAILFTGCVSKEEFTNEATLSRESAYKQWEGLPLKFGCDQDGVEVFLVEVMQPDLMPLGLQGMRGRGSNGVVEAAVLGMSQDY